MYVIVLINVQVYFRKAKDEANAVRRKAEAAGALPPVHLDVAETKSLKPVPVTTTGQIGWLASKFVNIQLRISTAYSLRQ